MWTRRYNVLTVAPNSSLPLRNRSSMLAGDILMSPSAARPAVKQRERDTTTPAVTGLTARCITQYALHAVRIVKCLLSLERAGPYIVVNATAR